MRNSHSARFCRVLEMMMTPPNMHQHPAIGFEFGNDVPTVHSLIIHTIHTPSTLGRKPANGSRYPLVGGTRPRRFAGTNFKPRKLPENAQSPTSRVHAVLASPIVWSINRLM